MSVFIPDLLGTLKSSDAGPSEKNRALRMIGSLGSAGRTWALEVANLLGDMHWSVRVAAAETLVALGPDAVASSASPLRRALDDKEPDVRLAVVRSFGSLQQAVCVQLDDPLGLALQLTGDLYHRGGDEMKCAALGAMQGLLRCISSTAAPMHADAARDGSAGARVLALCIAEIQTEPHDEVRLQLVQVVAGLDLRLARDAMHDLVHMTAAGTGRANTGPRTHADGAKTANEPIQRDTSLQFLEAVRRVDAIRLVGVLLDKHRECSSPHVLPRNASERLQAALADASNASSARLREAAAECQQKLRGYCQHHGFSLEKDPDADPGAVRMEGTGDASTVAVDVQDNVAGPARGPGDATFASLGRELRQAQERTSFFDRSFAHRCRDPETCALTTGGGRRLAFHPHCLAATLGEAYRAGVLSELHRRAILDRMESNLVVWKAAAESMSAGHHASLSADLDMAVREVRESGDEMQAIQQEIKALAADWRSVETAKTFERSKTWTVESNRASALPPHLLTPDSRASRAPDTSRFRRTNAVHTAPDTCTRPKTCPGPKRWGASSIRSPTLRSPLSTRSAAGPRSQSAQCLFPPVDAHDQPSLHQGRTTEFRFRSPAKFSPLRPRLVFALADSP